MPVLSPQGWLPSPACSYQPIAILFSHLWIDGTRGKNRMPSKAKRLVSCSHSSPSPLFSESCPSQKGSPNLPEVAD